MIEHYQILQRTCMWGIAIFGILAILSTLGWNHYSLKIKDLEKQSKQPTEEKKLPKKETTITNHYNIKGDLVKGDKSEIKAPNALIVTNNQTGGNNTINYYQNEFRAPNIDITNSIQSNIENLLTQYSTHPSIIIEIESGSTQRNQIAIQLENYLKTNNLATYPKGNTSIGRFPDYPITLIFNPENKKYVTDFMKSISPYINSEYHLEEINSFPSNIIKLYINGQPFFDPSGKVKID